MGTRKSHLDLIQAKGSHTGCQARLILTRNKHDKRTTHGKTESRKGKGFIFNAPGSPESEQNGALGRGSAQALLYAGQRCQGLFLPSVVPTSFKFKGNLGSLTGSACPVPSDQTLSLTSSPLQPSQLPSSFQTLVGPLIPPKDPSAPPALCPSSTSPFHSFQNCPFPPQDPSLLLSPA